jgi:prevent-host-death family protein
MRNWTSNKKGDVAEAAVRLAAMKLDVGVYAPVNDHSRVDMIFEMRNALYRIQCKWGRLSPAGDVLIVHSSGFRLTSGGHVRRAYSEEEIDFLAVYAGELDRCFLLPPSIFAGRHQVQLRLTPARNNQQACINLADQYDLQGAVAQLARASGWQPEGRGFESLQLHLPSSPDSAPARSIGSEELRVKLGQVLEQVAGGEEIVITRRGRPQIRMSPA